MAAVSAAPPQIVTGADASTSRTVATLVCVSQVPVGAVNVAWYASVTGPSRAFAIDSVVAAAPSSASSTGTVPFTTKVGSPNAYAASASAVASAVAAAPASHATVAVTAPAGGVAVAPAKSHV